jgi:hypothetical protein
LATFSKLNSGSWRAQVRRKGKYVNETFLRRKDAEEWALEVERRIDRGEPAIARSSRDARTFGDLIKLHREDLQEVGKRIGRSKGVSLSFLEHRLGRLRIPELDRGRLIQFGKERAREGAGPATVGIDLEYIKTILSHAAAVHGVILSVEAVLLARIALARLGLVGSLVSDGMAAWRAFALAYLLQYLLHLAGGERPHRLRVNVALPDRVQVERGSRHFVGGFRNHHEVVLALQPENLFDSDPELRRGLLGHLDSLGRILDVAKPLLGEIVKRHVGRHCLSSGLTGRKYVRTPRGP